MCVTFYFELVVVAVCSLFALAVLLFATAFFGWLVIALALYCALFVLCFLLVMC